MALRSSQEATEISALSTGAVRSSQEAMLISVNTLRLPAPPPQFAAAPTPNSFFQPSSVSATVLYRAVSASGDPLWGNGQASYLTDADAVALLIQTRLELFVGEWWAATGQGLWAPLTGPGLTPEQKALAIQARILSTPYVTRISDMDYGNSSSTRQFTFSATVETQFGQVQVTSGPSFTVQAL